VLGWTAFISRAFLFARLDRLRRKEVRNLATVTLRPNESQEQLLKRFRKKVAKSGILSTVRRKRWFVSKSELRRIDKKKAVRRHKRRQVTDAE
jgi:small subunit ribosomal protein S21